MPILIFLSQAEPFVPHDLEGWLRVLATIIGAALGSWALVMATVTRSLAHERELTVNAVALLRKEHEDAMEQEKTERELADKRIEERMLDIAQKVHIWMGKFDLLADRINEDRLAATKELAAVRLEIERGFGAMRDLLHNCPYREDHPPRGEQ